VSPVLGGRHCDGSRVNKSFIKWEAAWLDRALAIRRTDSSASPQRHLLDKLSYNRVSRGMLILVGPVTQGFHPETAMVFLSEASRLAEEWTERCQLWEDLMGTDVLLSSRWPRTELEFVRSAPFIRTKVICPDDNPWTDQRPANTRQNHLTSSTTFYSFCICRSVYWHIGSVPTTV